MLLGLTMMQHAVVVLTEKCLFFSGIYITALDLYRKVQNAKYAAQVNTATLHTPSASLAGQANIR
jgi:hypothetical protein